MATSLEEDVPLSAQLIGIGLKESVENTTFDSSIIQEESLKSLERTEPLGLSVATSLEEDALLSAQLLEIGLKKESPRLDSPISLLQEEHLESLKRTESQDLPVATSLEEDLPLSTQLIGIGLKERVENSTLDSPIIQEESLKSLKRTEPQDLPVTSLEEDNLSFLQLGGLELLGNPDETLQSMDVSHDERIDTLEQSMKDLIQSFSRINEKLFDHTLENVRLQQDNLVGLKKRSTEFKRFLSALDPVVNREILSEQERRRVERLMSQFSDYLGWVDDLDFKAFRLLNPRPTTMPTISLKALPQLDFQRDPIPELMVDVTPSSSDVNTVISPTETITPSNGLHLVLRLRAPSSELNTETSDTPLSSTETITPTNGHHLVLRLRASSSDLNTGVSLEENLRSSAEFIQNLQTSIHSVDYNLFGNHAEENLNLQEKKLDKLMKETDEVESGLLSLKSTLSHSDEQSRVQDVLTLFDEVDCMFARTYNKIGFIRSRSSLTPSLSLQLNSEPVIDITSLSTVSLDEQLKLLSTELEDLREGRSSIDVDLYEDQREPSSLKGHGEESLRFQGKKLSQLQEKSREIGKRLLNISQATEEFQPKQQLQMGALIGSFNTTISELRQVQTRLNLLKSKSSVVSLETEDPLFSFIPSFGVTGSQKMLPSDLSTDLNPEEEFVSLEKSTQELKRDLVEFKEAVFGEHAVESLQLHEVGFSKLQETARALESRFMFIDSQIPRDWRSPQRQQMNELIYSFGDTLCLVRKTQEQLNFLKSPSLPSSSPSLSVPTVTLGIGEETEGTLNEDFKSEKESLEQLYSEISGIDGNLYSDHTETNLNLQGEKLSQAKKTLHELEERLSTLDSQTSTDLQAKPREALNSLLGSLSKSQCFIRDVEKRFNHLKSSTLPPRTIMPVIQVSSTVPDLTVQKKEGVSSSLSTEDPLTESLKEVEESLKLGIGLIDEDLYSDHTEENLSLQEKKLLQAKETLSELEKRLISLDSQVSRDLQSPQRMFINSLLSSCSDKQCSIRDVETRLKHLKSVNLPVKLIIPVINVSSTATTSVLDLEQEKIIGSVETQSLRTEDPQDELLRSLEKRVDALIEEQNSIDEDLYEDQRENPSPLKGHGALSLRYQEIRLSMLQEKAETLQLNLMSLDSQITKDPLSKQREKLDQLTCSFKENALCSLRVKDRLRFWKTKL
ncbi:MAG: hypothetical protein HYX35_04715 [Proteobacteria bacterium]|nr:hypothetical protein [Pseudomonadota bacterium]